MRQTAAAKKRQDGTDDEGKQIYYSYKLTGTTVKKYKKYVGYEIFYDEDEIHTSNLFYTICVDEICEMLANGEFYKDNFVGYNFIALNSYPEK